MPRPETPPRTEASETMPAENLMQARRVAAEVDTELLLKTVSSGCETPPAEAQALYAPPVGLDPRAQATLQALREAVHSRRVVQVDYADVNGRPSLRRLRPLGCFYWGKVWTLSAWCELRNDFRGFRIDRISAITVLDEQFRQEPGKTLADLLRKVEGEMEGRAVEWAAAPGQQ